MIKLENIRFKREDRDILKGLHLHMKKGEHWVILGKNGSGKTTILELITGYQFASSGTMEVLGNIYGQVDLREVRKRIGYVSQSLFEKLTPRDPVWEVVATGEMGYLRFYENISDELRERALDRLELVGLSHLQNNPIGTLSQGERKKVMLARALMTNPEVLIMDEPCSGLDLYERENMLTVIERLGKEPLNMVYVTHHIEEISPVFTHVALLEAGEWVFTGTKEETLTADNLYKAYGVPLTLEWDHGRPWIRVVSH